MWDDTALSRLVELGNVRQNDEPETDVRQQAAEERFDAYLKLVDSITGREEDRILEALLRSVHDVEDYGAYEATLNAVWTFSPTRVGAVAGAVLPDWLSGFTPLSTNLNPPRILVYLPGDAAAESAFHVAASSWTSEQRDAVAIHLARWVEDDAQWEEIAARYGAEIHRPGSDLPGDDWPAHWKQALADLREGNVGGVWADERTPENNFPLVFALLELDHGKAWREVGMLLNPLSTWARPARPAFDKALAELPDERRERILAVITKVRPKFFS